MNEIEAMFDKAEEVFGEPPEITQAIHNLITGEGYPFFVPDEPYGDYKKKISPHTPLL